MATGLPWNRPRLAGTLALGFRWTTTSQDDEPSEHGEQTPRRRAGADSQRNSDRAGAEAATRRDASASARRNLGIPPPLPLAPPAPCRPRSGSGTPYTG